MRRAKVITMALIAVFALAAVTASSAFAAGKGEIVNKSGVVPAKNGFKGESSKEGNLETVAGSKITCTKTTFAGTIKTVKTGEATFAFTGCSSAGLKCKTSNTTVAGEVKVPVTLEGATESSAGTGKDYLLNKVTEFEITCSTIKIKVKGALLIPATPEGKLATKYTFNAVGSKGTQTPELSATQLKTISHLEANFAGKGFEKASLKAEELATTFEEEVEFR